MNAYINRKIVLSQRLYTDSKYSGYADAVLVLCATISAIAARVWPGKNINKKRFVELLISYSNDNLKAKYVSVPLLYQFMKEKGNLLVLSKELRDLMESARILKDEDIDLSECKMLDKYPTINRKVLRKYSYASLLYEEIRCSYMHEYVCGSQASSFPMTSKKSNVSYVNHLSNNEKGTYQLLIHFHYDYLIALVECINQRLSPFEQYECQPVPKKWWLEG